MPRVRFTVRRMMIVVAIVAGMLGVSTWMLRTRVRERRYRAMAAQHAQEAARYQEYMDTYPAFVAELKAGGIAEADIPSQFGTIEWRRRRRDHYSALQRKYEEAAIRPWDPVPPDPPEPD